MSYPHPPFYKGYTKLVPIEKIDNIMDDNFDRERVAEMMKSILENGLRTPLEVVSHSNGNYSVTDGNHRIKALQKLGWKEIPCFVITNW